MTYHLTNIRALLTDGFTVEELRRFCFDTTTFRPVYEQLAPESGAAVVVDRLLEYAERRLLLEALLAWAKATNLARYEQHQPYLAEVIEDRVQEKIKTEGAEPGALVYLHCFGSLPVEMSKEAYQLDWRSYFNGEPTPRRVPSPAIWRKTLLPQLAALSQEIKPPQQVALCGSASLTAGFAFGRTFKEVAHYRLEVEQFSGGKKQPWTSFQKPPVGSVQPTWISRVWPGQPDAADGVVIVLANPRQVLDQIIGQVGLLWGEAELFSQETSQCLKGVLILEAAATSQEKRHLENWEAVALAEASSQPLRQFIRQTQPKKLHLFLAVPLALAVFMGHQWNAVGKKVHCYEWVGGEKAYTPACELTL